MFTKIPKKNPPYHLGICNSTGSLVHKNYIRVFGIYEQLSKFSNIILNGFIFEKQEKNEYFMKFLKDFFNLQFLLKHEYYSNLNKFRNMENYKFVKTIIKL